MLQGIFKKHPNFEKHLFNSSIYNSMDVVLINDIKSLIKEEDDQLVQSMTIVQIFKEFVRLLPKHPPLLVKLKLILTAQMLMADIKYGRLFVQQFINWSGWSKEEPIVGLHLMVVQKLSLIYDQLHKSKLFSNINSYFKDLEASKLHFYKIVNFLIFFLSQQDIFKTCLNQKKYDKIFKELYNLFWNDIFAMYLLLERFIIRFINNFREIDKQQALQIYELFKEYIKITPQMKMFWQIQSPYSQYQCNLNWFNIAEDTLDDLNKYFLQIINVKKRKERSITSQIGQDNNTQEKKRNKSQEAKDQ